MCVGVHVCTGVTIKKHPGRVKRGMFGKVYNFK
jgi:hypothetical protein